MYIEYASFAVQLHDISVSDRFSIFSGAQFKSYCSAFTNAFARFPLKICVQDFHNPNMCFDRPKTHALFAKTKRAQEGQGRA